MFKSFVVIAFSVILTTSILAPSISNLIDLDVQTMTFFEIPEEESPNKSEKEIYEKDVFFPSIQGPSSSDLSNVQQSNMYYLEDSSTYYLKIHLPPPEQPL